MLVLFSTKKDISLTSPAIHLVRFSLEASHQDTSIAYPLHVLWTNDKISDLEGKSFLACTGAIWYLFHTHPIIR